MRWTAAQGWAVEFIDIEPGTQAPPERGPRPTRRAPAPLAGPQFAVTRYGMIVGYYRDAEELVRAGVPETVVQQIRRAIRGGA